MLFSWLWPHKNNAAPLCTVNICNWFWNQDSSGPPFPLMCIACVKCPYLTPPPFSQPLVVFGPVFPLPSNQRVCAVELKSIERISPLWLLHSSLFLTLPIPLTLLSLSLSLYLSLLSILLSRLLTLSIFLPLFLPLPIPLSILSPSHYLFLPISSQTMFLYLSSHSLFILLSLLSTTLYPSISPLSHSLFIYLSSHSLSILLSLLSLTL